MPPAVAFCTRVALHDDEKVMEQEPLEVEREGCEHTEEVDSLVPSPQNSTDSDRQIEEEDEVELSDKPTGEPTNGPMDGTAVKLIKGHPPDDELTEGHPPDNELAEDHSLDDELMETITVECPTLGWKLPLGSA